LFGLDHHAAIGRRDRRGAAFFLVGAEVLALTEDALTIRIGGAVQRVYRRSPPLKQEIAGLGIVICGRPRPRKSENGLI
jgi:hypothetical protein